MKSTLILFIILVFIILNSQFLFTQPQLLPGYPKIIDNYSGSSDFSTSPIAFDFDKNGNKEILFGTKIGFSPGTGNKIFVVKLDGTIMPGWPKTLSTYDNTYSAVGDIDGDSVYEIIIRTNYALQVFSYDGNNKPGFPININIPPYYPYVLINDIDNNGELEILTRAPDINSVCVYEHDGSIRQGWPKRLISGNDVWTMHFSTGDLNSDGIQELFVPTANVTYPPLLIDSVSLFIFEPDGTNYLSSPIRLDSMYYFEWGGAVVLKQPLTDSMMFVLLSNYSPDYIHDYRTRIDTYNEQLHLRNRFYVFPLYDVTLVSPFIRNNSVYYAFGELGYQLYLYTQNGNLQPGWPVTANCNSMRTLSIGKLNGDYVFVAVENWADTNGGYQHPAGYINAFDINGQALPWSPLRTDGIASAAVTFDDVNNDGQAEMIVVSGCYTGPNQTGAMLYIWTFPGVSYTRENFPWPMYGHDRYRSFQLGFIPPDEPIGIQPISSGSPKEFTLYQNYPNPFNPATTIKYTVRTSSIIKLLVYDILGREVYEIVNEKQKPGTYALTFDGSNLSSGVFFYRLTSDGVTVNTKKMVFLK